MVSDASLDPDTAMPDAEAGSDSSADADAGGDANDTADLDSAHDSADASSDCDGGVKQCAGGARQTCLQGQWSNDPCPTATPYCVDDGACVECTTSAQCPSSTACAKVQCGAGHACVRPTGGKERQLGQDANGELTSGNTTRPHRPPLKIISHEREQRKCDQVMQAV